MLEDCYTQIKDIHLQEMTKYFLDKYELTIRTIPPSLSGKYHETEKTLGEHLRRTFWFATQMSIEMNLSKEDTSILQTSALLHDIANCEYSYTENKPEQFTTEYPTGWYRSKDAYKYHGVLSGFLIGEYMSKYTSAKVLEKIIKVALIVSSHMGHWHSECPQPTSDLQKYLAISDYFASRKEVILNI